MEGRRLARVYAEAFSEEYRASNPPEAALADIAHLEGLGEEPFGMDITNPEELHFGLRASVQARGRPTSSIEVFWVQTRAGQPLDLERDRQRVVEAGVALLQGRAENDRLNNLVVTAGLTWREVALLRTYQMYSSPIDAATSRRFVNHCLLRHPGAEAALVGSFHARFGPLEGSDREVWNRA